MKKIPDTRGGSYKLLAQLLVGSGTFYQICERAKIDIESGRAERIQRELFDSLIVGGHAHLVGLIYYITTAARDAISPPAPTSGQVAGPAYRGIHYPTPVKIARRAAGAQA